MDITTNQSRLLFRMIIKMIFYQHVIFYRIEIVKKFIFTSEIIYDISILIINKLIKIIIHYRKNIKRTTKFKSKELFYNQL